MIREKQKLSGNLSAKGLLNGSLSNSVIYVDPITQEKEVMPTRETQEITPDTGYTGLSKVKVNGYIPNTASKIISSNGTYKAENDNLDGYNEVNVQVLDGSASDYFMDTIKSGSSNKSGLNETIKKIPLFTITGSDCSYMFAYCRNLTSIPLLDTSDVTNMSRMFYYSGLKTVPKLDTSKVTRMDSMFEYCSYLTEVPLLNTSNVTNMYRMFIGCSLLTTIPKLNTSNVTSISQMFQGCKKLTSIPKLDTSNVTSASGAFYQCSLLTTIPELNTSNVTDMNQMFNSCLNLIEIPLLNASRVINIKEVINQSGKISTLGGFQNLGEAYLTTQSSNYLYYKLILSNNTILTHDSLMNVINNLYDIATKGCKSQSLVLGTTNIAKLTEEEIAIATSKGWTVS